MPCKYDSNIRWCAVSMKESSMVVAGSLMEIVDSVIVSMIEIFGNAHCSHGRII